MKAIKVDLVTLYQNLNSGSRRMNGRNSSFALVGRLGPSSAKDKIKNEYKELLVTKNKDRELKEVEWKRKVEMFYITQVIVK